MEQRILLLLASSIVLAGGPSKTCVSPLEEKPVHKRENEMSTLQINSYPSSSSSSELCLKTTGDFSQLATCPTGTGTDSFHFTIGSFAKGQYFIKSVVNGKCLDFATPTSDNKYPFTNCNSNYATVPYAPKNEIVSLNNFNYTTLSVPVSGHALPKNLGDFGDDLFISQDSPRIFQGTSNIVVRFLDTLTKTKYNHLTVMDNPSIVFVQSTFNQILIETDRTPDFQESNLYQSRTWDGRKISYQNIPLAYIDTIPTVPNLKPDPIGSNVTVPINYRLSFSITPMGTLNAPSGILRYGANLPRGGHMPYIEMMGLTTRLNVIFSTTWSTEESFQSPPLPLYQTTRVKIETEYNTIKFYFNDTLVQTSRTHGWRSSGDAFLNVSQSKLQPALVHLVDVVMKELPSIGLTPNLAQQKVPTQVIVPQNYIIAFNITPLLNSGYFENILEYVGNDLPSYVLPSITFPPRSTALLMAFGTSVSTYEQVESPALPLYKTTLVRIVFNYTQVEVFYDNVLKASYKTAGWRKTGPASLYVSNTQDGPACVHLGPVILTALPFEGLVPNLKANPTGSKVTVPINYEVSFSLTPMGTQAVRDGSGILRYGANLPRGGHMPDIQLASSTTRLMVTFSTTWSTEESFQSPALPLYQTTRVKISAFNKTIKFYFNDILVHNCSTIGSRISGEAYLNVSQSKLQPALAHLADAVMNGI